MAPSPDAAGSPPALRPPLFGAPEMAEVDGSWRFDGRNHGETILFRKLCLEAAHSLVSDMFGVIENIKKGVYLVTYPKNIRVFTKGNR